LPALITESELVGDDWLIDDVRGGFKRKRPDMDSLLKDVNIRMEKKRNRQQPTSSGQMSEASRVRDWDRRTSVDRSFAEEIFDSESASPESTIMLNDEIAASSSRELPTSGAALQRKKQARLNSSCSIVDRKNKSESVGQSVTSTTVTKPPAAPVPAAPVPDPLKMRLKVRISDQLILVPILERFVASFPLDKIVSLYMCFVFLFSF